MGPKGFSSTFWKKLDQNHAMHDFQSCGTIYRPKGCFEPSTYGSLRILFRAEPYKTVALTRLSYGPIELDILGQFKRFSEIIHFT